MASSPSTSMVTSPSSLPSAAPWPTTARANNHDSVWVNDMLDMSAHISTEGAAAGDITIYYKASGATIALEEHRQRTQVVPFVHRCAHGEVQLEVYQHQAPIEGIFLRRFVTLARVQDFVFGVSTGSKFICTHYDRWVGLVRSMPMRSMCLS